MNERTVSHESSQQAAPPAPLPPAWEAFEKALASALSVLRDEFLIVSTKAGNRFVQFNACPDQGVFAEAVCNAYLEPGEKLDVGQMAALLSLGWAPPTHAPDSATPVSPPRGSPNHFREFPRPYSCAEISRFAVRTLTESLRVGTPAELEYRAFDAEGHAVTLPVLHIDREPAPPPRTKTPGKPRGPSAFERLRTKVLAAARNETGLGSLAYDDDGTLLVPVGSRMGWVRPNEQPFFVRVHIHLLSDVEGDEDFLAQVHEMNSRLPMARVIYKGRNVYLGVDFPAVPFRAEHLAQAVTTLALLAEEVLEELRLPADPVKVEN